MHLRLLNWMGPWFATLLSSAWQPALGSCQTSAVLLGESEKQTGSFKLFCRLGTPALHTLNIDVKFRMLGPNEIKSCYVKCILHHFQPNIPSGQWFPCYWKKTLLTQNTHLVKTNGQMLQHLSTGFYYKCFSTEWAFFVCAAHAADGN